MPVHDAIGLGQCDSDQPTSARPATALTRFGSVGGTVGGTHQPLAGRVEKTVGLVVHLHWDMGTAVEVGVGTILKPNGKPTARLAAVNHIKRHRFATIFQV